MYCIWGTHVPYHLQKVQSLHTDDYSCQVRFVQWMLRMKNNDLRFPALILLICHFKPQCTNANNGKASFDKIQSFSFHKHESGDLQNQYFSANNVTYCTQGTHVSYHEQKVQSLHTDDYPCQAGFVQWMLNMKNNDPRFPELIFSDEAKFSREDIVNMCNQHVWFDCNATSLSLVNTSRNLSWTSGQVTLVITW